MMFILGISLFVCQALAATTVHPTHHHPTHPHRTHATHEPSVTDSFNFRYDPHTHMMAAMSHRKCYLYSMTGQESVDVHTAHGLHTLETKLINMIDDTTMTYKTMTHDEVTAASAVLAKICNHAGFTSYKLN